MLDVRKMMLLRDLSRLGSIAAVAEARYCTPSAVSQQLAALERTAGVALIRRSGRGVELTDAGTDLADRTGPVLALLEEAAAAMAAGRAELTGELRIGAFPTAMRTILPAVLARLGTGHPRLELRVTELDPAQVPAALLAGTLDVALTHEYDYVPALPEPGLAAQPLLTEQIFLATAAGGNSGDRGDGGNPLLANAGLPWIAASPGTLCHLMAIRLCQAAGFAPRIRHYADDFAAVLSLVAAGQGVALVPELAVADTPPGVRLAALPASRRTLVACRAGGSGHPAVAAAIAAFRAAAAGYRAPA